VGYTGPAALGNLNALATGRVPQRMARVAAGRAFGRGMRASGCLLRLLVVLVSGVLYLALIVLAAPYVEIALHNAIGWVR
jgi:hypothetical protein